MVDGGIIFVAESGHVELNNDIGSKECTYLNGQGHHLSFVEIKIRPVNCGTSPLN